MAEGQGYPSSGDNPSGTPSSEGDKMMDSPLPGAEDMSQEEPSEEVTSAEAKQDAVSKVGAIIEAAGEALEKLVETGQAEDGSDIFNAIGDVMASAQTALDILNGEGTEELTSQESEAGGTEPNVEIPAPEAV